MWRLPLVDGPSGNAASGHSGPEGPLSSPSQGRSPAFGTPRDAHIKPDDPVRVPRPEQIPTLEEPTPRPDNSPRHICPFAMLSSSSLRVASRAPFKAVRGARFASGHGGHKAPAHLPFTYDKKGAFVAKLTGFVTLGFGVPFLASAYQLRKSGGAA